MILRHLTLNGNAEIQFGSSKYEKRQDCKVASDRSRRVIFGIRRFYRLVRGPTWLQPTTGQHLISHSNI